MSEKKMEAAGSDDATQATLLAKALALVPWVGVTIGAEVLILRGAPPLLTGFVFALIALAGMRSELSALYWRAATFDAMGLADKCFDATEDEKDGT